MKKGIVKRFLSVLLVLIMVVSVLPMSAMAAGFQSMTVSGKTVNVGFGATLDPADVLPGYDIKAVAAIKVGYDADAENNLSAEGAVEMLIPKSTFKNVIMEKVPAMVSGHFDMDDPNSTLYKTLNTPLDEGIPVYIPIVDKTIYVEGSPIQIVSELLGDKTTVDGIEVKYSDYINVETELTNLALTVLDGKLGLFDESDAIPAWVEDTMAAGVVGVEAQLTQLAAVYAAAILNSEFMISVDPFNYHTLKWKTCSEIQSEFVAEEKVEAIANAVMAMKASAFDFVYASDADNGAFKSRTLEEWFELYKKTLNNAVSGYGVEVPNLPTDKIADLEEMLKSIVANVNGTTADAVTLDRKIIGKSADDKLSSSNETGVNETGVYVVAGVDMDGTYAYELYVVAPDTIDMRTAIEKDGTDAGYVINHTYDGSAAPVNVNSAFVDEDLTVRYVGVETDGGTYNSEDAPTNAGVYTVFALSLDKETLRMGGDIAMLVIEPAQTENYDFTTEWKNKVITVPAGSTTEYFPALVTNPYLNITVATNAVDKNGENVAYVNLPEGFADIVGVYTDYAGNLLTKIEADTALPMPNYLAGRVLGALDNAAQKVGNGGSLTATEFKVIVKDYLTAVEKWYDSEDVLTRAGDMVDKMKNALAENTTVKQYMSLFESLQGSLESMPFSARVGQVGYSVQATSEADKLGSAASKFLDRFMEEADISKDDVRALLQSLLNTIENSSYKQDAETLVKTLCAIFRVDTATVDDAMDAVDVHYGDLKAGVKALNIDVTDPQIADAQAVLALISDFIGDVKGVIDTAIVDVDLDIVYFGKNPSAVGTYNCYAVNVAANYVPTMATTTLTIKTAETHTHSYTAVVTEPTCTEQGYTTYTCTCGDEYVADYVKATGKHTYENGVCTSCGKEIIVTGRSLLLEDIVQIKYYVGFDPEIKSRITSAGMYIWDNEADANAHNFSTAFWHTTEARDEGSYKGSYEYSFRSEGIPAKEMGDLQYAVIYIVVDGVTYYSAVETYSPKTWCENKKDDAKEKDIAAALMNYGAAAQIYFDYKTEDLMNVGFDTYSFSLDQLTTTSREKGSGVNGFTENGISMILTGAIQYKVYYKASGLEGKTGFGIEYQIGNGEVQTIEGFEQGTNEYFVKIEGIAAKNLDEVVTIRPFYTENGERVYGAESTFCAEVWIYNKITSTKTSEQAEKDRAFAPAFGNYISSANIRFSK